MRTLSLNEISSVAGAGYAEDITATAATIFVAGSISAATTGAIYGAGMGLATAIGVTNPVGWAIGAMTMVTAPAMGLGVPAAIAAKMFEVNPGLQNALVDKYHSYFG
ncbi:MAG: hypothetical protein ACHQJ6_05405 [Candidatus Berkiellales bacterium]